MNTRYDVTNNVSRPVAETDGARVKSPRGDSATTGTAQQAVAAPSQDGVKLLSTEVADLARSADIVDQAKVERLREAIANGTYQIDADAIAEKLVDFEDALNGGSDA